MTTRTLEIYDYDLENKTLYNILKGYTSTGWKLSSLVDIRSKNHSLVYRVVFTREDKPSVALSSWSPPAKLQYAKNIKFWHRKLGTGMVTIAADICWMDTSRKIPYGISLCSPGDQFCKATGREKALNRLNTHGPRFRGQTELYHDEGFKDIPDAVMEHIGHSDRLPRWAFKEVPKKEESTEQLSEKLALAVNALEDFRLYGTRHDPHPTGWHTWSGSDWHKWAMSQDKSVRDAATRHLQTIGTLDFSADCPF